MVEKSIPSKTSFPYFRKFNGAMAGLHFVQAMLMLVLGLIITNIKEFTLPLNFYFQSFDFEKMKLVLSSETIGNIPIGPLVAVFLFLSAIAHFLVALPKINNFYNSNLEKGINYFRWFEYTVDYKEFLSKVDCHLLM